MVELLKSIQLKHFNSDSKIDLKLLIKLMVDKNSGYLLFDTLSEEKDPI